MKPKVLLIGMVLLIAACHKNNVTETIPTGPVSLTIDLNLPSNQHLAVVGGFGYFTGGVRGVLVIHDYDDNWYAFERTCAYQPLNDCSMIWVDTQGIQLKCGKYNGSTFTSCCESRFLFSGFPNTGPAKGRLAQYKIQKNSNLLYIYN